MIKGKNIFYTDGVRWHNFERLRRFSLKKSVNIIACSKGQCSKFHYGKLPLVTMCFYNLILVSYHSQPNGIA